MSLINEMLQDLDSRKHLQTTEAVCDAEIAVPPDNSAGSRTAWIILGLLFLVFIGFWFVQTLVIGSEPAKPTPNELAPRQPKRRLNDRLPPQRKSTQRTF